MKLKGTVLHNPTSHVTKENTPSIATAMVYWSELVAVTTFLAEGLPMATHHWRNNGCLDRDFIVKDEWLGDDWRLHSLLDVAC